MVAQAAHTTLFPARSHRFLSFNLHVVMMDASTSVVRQTMNGIFSLLVILLDVLLLLLEGVFAQEVLDATEPPKLQPRGVEVSGPEFLESHRSLDLH